MLLLSEHFDVNNVTPVMIFKKDLADRMHFKVALKVIGHQRLIVSSLFDYSEGNNTKYIRKTHSFPNSFAPNLNGVSLFRTHVNIISNIHNIETSSVLKPLGQSKPNLTWSILGKQQRKFI